MAYGTVEDRVILPIPGAIFGPALRIDVALDADHGRGLCCRLGRGGSRSRRGSGGRRGVSRRGAWGLLAAWGRAAIGLGLGVRGYSAPAQLFLRGVEQIVGLVRRLGLRPFIGGGRFLAGFGFRTSGFLRRFFVLIGLCASLARRRQPAQLFLGGVEQIVGLVRRLGRRPFIGNGRFLAGLGVGGIGLSVRVLRLGRRGLGCDCTGCTLARRLLLGLSGPARFGAADRVAIDGQFRYRSLPTPLCLITRLLPTGHFAGEIG